MAPSPTRQIWWGAATAIAVLAVVLLLAFVPDPLGRERVIGTRFDNVESLGPGAPVYFRGAQMGSVRSVALDPATRLFDVRLGVRRDWRPSACAFAEITSSNPLAPPRIELIALETDAGRCPAARAAASCDRLAPQATGTGGIDGCRRGPDLFQSAAAAVAEAAAVAKTANGLARQLATLTAGSGGASSAGSPIQVAKDSMATVAALRSISERLDSGFAPGRGDIALTLANVRRATGSASSFDVTGLNQTIEQLQTLVKTNQENIAGILAEGRQTTAQTRALVEAMSASLATTSANLARVSDSMGALSERLAADPTYTLRGSRFADPPAPGSTP